MTRWIAPNAARLALAWALAVSGLCLSAEVDSADLRPHARPFVPEERIEQELTQAAAAIAFLCCCRRCRRLR